MWLTGWRGAAIIQAHRQTGAMMIRVYRVTFTDAWGDEDSMYFNGTGETDVYMNFNRHYPAYDLIAVALA
jgi:hypothetical protein